MTLMRDTRTILVTVDVGDKSITTVRNRSRVARRTDLTCEIVQTILGEREDISRRHLTTVNNADPGSCVRPKYDRLSNGRSRRFASRERRPSRVNMESSTILWDAKCCFPQALPISTSGTNLVRRKLTERAEKRMEADHLKICTRRRNPSAWLQPPVEACSRPIVVDVCTWLLSRTPA